MSKFMVIFNYFVRVLTIIIGAVFCFRIVEFPTVEPMLVSIMGVVMMLWGIYRIIRFRAKYNEYKNNGEEE